MIAVVMVALTAAAIVAAALILTSKTGGKSSNAHASASTGAGVSASHDGSFNPASVTVAVLNGTATPGLAGRTSKRLSAAGYRPGAVATASDQTQTTTVVAYLPGYRADAARVAASLKLPPTAVQPVDSASQAVACPPPSACSANVVVTVGSDLASS